MQFSQLQQAVVAASRVNTLLREGEAARGGNAGAIAAGAVSFRDIRFGYDAAHPVLHGVSLAVPAGRLYRHCRSYR